MRAYLVSINWINKLNVSYVRYTTMHHEDFVINNSCEWQPGKYILNNSQYFGSMTLKSEK